MCGRTLRRVVVAGQVSAAVDDAALRQPSLNVGESRAQVLIVARDQELVELFGYMFQRAGLRYARATDGTSAVELYASVRPSVVLLDTHGLDLLQHFRGNGDSPAIIILTTDNTDEARLTALERGADDYVTKPFSPRELIARIRTRLTLGPPDGGATLS